MISIADLVKKQERLGGNYFAPDAYIRGDFEAGMLENRHGDRLMAIPETLIEGIYAGMEAEIGQASGLVLFNCGHSWGKKFYARFVEEVTTYYGKPIAEMSMVELLQCLKECWKTYGWGTFELDVSFYQYGFLLVNIGNSPFAEKAPKTNHPVCYFEAGILSAFFSQLTGEELHCIQTTCESMGAESNKFIIGLRSRLKVAEAWVAEEQEHNTIIKHLCQQKSSEA